jgi:hypothetical protein
MHRAQMRAEQEQEAPAERAPERIAAAPPPPQPVTPRIEDRPVGAAEPAPRADIRESLESAGLQMVETKADRPRAPEPEAEAVPLGRPRAERPRAAAEDEPLVQVETKH